VNKKQKAVLITVMVLVAGIMFIPPFQLNGEHLGYGPIVGDIYPKGAIYDREGYPLYRVTGGVNVPLLITQWVGVLVVGGAGLLLFKDR
jgi:hypothetical protein